MRLTVLPWLLLAGLCVAGPDCPPSVVRVGNTTGTGFNRREEGGSGVVVRSEKGRSLVVTNRHVVESGGRLAVYSVTGRWGPAKLLRYAPAGDLAVLEVPFELPVAELAEAVEPGTALTLWGFPDGELPVRKTGHVRPRDGSTIRGLDVLPTSIRSEDGDSGGGQFDRDGRLVCLSITSAGSTVPVAAVRALLESVK